MSAFCGLDFGTSNTAVGIINAGKTEIHKFADNSTIPSLIFFDLNDGNLYFGEEALTRYYKHQGGRIMKSLKSILGTHMLNEVCRMQMSTGENKLYTYKRIIGFFLEHVKKSLENKNEEEYSKVVVGRPVYFVDNNLLADQMAQNQIQEILEIQGFKDIVFQYEPLAALKTFESSNTDEQIVLVIDIGGGTADFSLVRIPKRMNQDIELNFQDILANDGIHIGGDDIDETISLQYAMPLLGYKSNLKSGIEMPSKNYFEMAKLQSLGSLYSLRNMKEVERLLLEAEKPELIENLITVISMEEAHLIRFRCENSKIELSDKDASVMDFSFIKQGMSSTIKRVHFEEAISSRNEKIMERINNMVKEAGVDPDNVSTLFFTGGTTKIPLLRRSLKEIFKNAFFQEGDTFSAVAKGLTMHAQQIYK